jgi:hypothetical protein
MARWRLTDKHYIHISRNGEPTQWEWKETNRDTGRVNRKVYTVPMYLDPNNPADQNHDGDVIIARQKGSHSKDLIVADDFVPTWDMEPLDDEAEALSAALKARGGAHPIDSLPAQGQTYAEHLLTRLGDQLERAMREAPPPSAPPDTGVIKKLQEDMAKLMEANAKMQAQLMAKPKGP